MSHATFRPCDLLCCAMLAVAGLGPVAAQEKAHLALSSDFQSYVEPGFPYLFQTFDARGLGKEWPGDNLVPRGILLSPGGGLHLCFDPDLLRVALIWRESDEGDWLSMNGMASGSYRQPAQKAGAGEKNLPHPLGTPLLATSLGAGWCSGETPDFSDPRPRGAADPGEVGLGPLPAHRGQWLGVTLQSGLPHLQYRIGPERILVSESFQWENGTLIRHLKVSPHATLLQCVLGRQGGEESPLSVMPGDFRLEQTPAGKVLLLPPSGETVSVKVVLRPSQTATPPTPPWPGFGDRAIETAIKIGVLDSGGLAVDRIALPVPNPWKRNVRLSGMDFFADGRAALSTFDGDVWIVSGFSGDSTKALWRRFASGLQEPMGLQVVDDLVYVFDRNGIERLHDRDGNGEADEVESFCDLVPQTAETREFAMDLVKKPGGGFYLAKGGQAPELRGLYNGTVIEVAADGKSFRRIGQGFRQPYIGVDPQTGTISASDQQGNWTPATPIHFVEPGNHHGFIAEGVKDQTQPYPIREPVCWIPHFINQSGASQVWLREAEMGPWKDALIHIGYNRPEIFRVFVDGSAGIRQGAVTPVLAGWPSAILKGAMHPIDHRLYLCGFKIWGTVASEISGFYRLRPSQSRVPVMIDARSTDRGVLLTFDRAPDPAAVGQVSSYTVDRWNYLRTKSYGSGHYRLDGEPGQESLPVSSVRLSPDGRSVFVGIPNMRPSHTLRVTFRAGLPGALPPAGGNPVNLNGDIRTVFFTVHVLKSVDLRVEGFPDNAVDLTLKAGTGAAIAAVKPSPEEGRKVYEMFGCMGCHTTDGSKAVAAPGTSAADAAKLAVGPTWKDLYGSKKTFSDGTELKAVDAVYLRESILDPGRKVVQGYELEKTGAGMPSYLGVLRDDQLESIVLYIQSLSGGGKKEKGQPK